MGKKALIVWGGWDGHEPKQVAAVLEGILKGQQFEVEVSNTLDVLLDKAKVAAQSVIVPCWTMGKMTGDQCKSVSEALVNGTGLAGLHGGMCDAFRENTEWQFITGGQFVSHPGGQVKYTVKPKGKHWITQGLKAFEHTSEQYYMHVDPSNKVLATTSFPVAEGPHTANGKFDMPVTWTRQWGKGRVFYCSLGHVAKELDVPEIRKMAERGMLWAANAEALIS
jgi:type 1 glutamine amidotransferase